MLGQRQGKSSGGGEEAQTRKLVRIELLVCYATPMGSTHMHTCTLRCVVRALTVSESNLPRPRPPNALVTLAVPAP